MAQVTPHVEMASEEDQQKHKVYSSHYNITEDVDSKTKKTQMDVIGQCL